MGFWSRHRRKILVAVGALGCGYALYKLYDSHKRRLIELGMETEANRRAEENTTAQLQIHFESIQRISETTILPHAMSYLRMRIAEELDIKHLTDKLMEGKGQANSLQPNEKFELWDRLKVLSFTKAAASSLAMVMLFLYVRIQVNILGRQLFLEAASSSETSLELDEANQVDRLCQQEFLATADYLSNHGLATLISKMESAALEVLRDKNLTDSFTLAHLSETMMVMLELFMNNGSSDSWVSYILPKNAAEYQKLLAMSSNGFDNSNLLMDISKLERLIAEAHAVLSSIEFRNIIQITLRKVVVLLMEDLASQLNVTSPGYPLAKLLPRVAQLGSAVLEEVGDNRYIAVIRGLPEVELFYTLLYADASQTTVLDTSMSEAQHSESG